MTGGSYVGQGFETAMAQICADTLGVDYRRVRVVYGQTDRIQYGIGAHASRASVMTGGGDACRGAQGARQGARDGRRELLQAPPDELDIVDGIVVRRDRAGSGARRSRSARSRDICAPDSPTPRRARPGLGAEGWFRTSHMTYPYGVHIAVVRVDRDTGR